MYTIPSLLNKSIKTYPNRPSLSFVDEQGLTYEQLGQKIQQLKSFLIKNEIKKNDKVILWGSNSPEWGIAYLAVTSMGAVIVPILPEVTIENAINIYSHSESKIAFLSQNIIDKSKYPELTQLIPSFVLESINPLISEEPINGEVDDSLVQEDDIAAIIYTSGTTGTPKGVMLTHRNVSYVGVHSGDIQPIDSEDRFLSLLPMAHTYENSIGFLFPMFMGANVHYLRKAPTPPVLVEAMSKIKPTLILSVPLIIEKLYRQRIKSKFSKNNTVGKLYKIPLIRKIIHYIAGRKLKKTFGGSLKFFGIGGAKLNSEVERFLIEARFPYAIGYGLTESAPLLAGANPKKAKFDSTGPAMPGVELKIFNPNPETGEGEIWVKGPNVMPGYFKDDEQTKLVLTNDGWLKTGDLGVLDKNNYLYIKGRLKNVIIGSNGKNIYPEEIEALINNCEVVNESLVLERKGRLVAIVEYNTEQLEAKYKALRKGITHKMEEVSELLREEILQYVNSRVSPLMRLSEIELQTIPFEKTATLKIKRYLYS